MLVTVSGQASAPELPPLVKVMVCVSWPVTTRQVAVSVTPDPIQTTGLSVGATRLIEPADAQVFEVESTMQLVVS